MCEGEDTRLHAPWRHFQSADAAHQSIGLALGPRMGRRPVAEEEYWNFMGLMH